jgi:hypothetical protein
MAGSRRASGRPRRSDHRAAWHRNRVQEATTAEQQLAAAYSWAVAQIARVPSAGTRTRLRREAATALIDLAAEAGGAT